MDMDEDDIEYEPDRLNDQFEVCTFLIPCTLGTHYLPSCVQDSEMTTPGVAEDIEKDIPLKLINFKLPPSRPLSKTEREYAQKSAITRIRDNALDLGTPPEVQGQTEHVGLPASDMWMLLLVRMVTRASVIEGSVTDSQTKKEEEGMTMVETHDDDRRRVLCNYVLEDFSSRLT
jgi:symplekin